MKIRTLALALTFALSACTVPVADDGAASSSASSVSSVSSMQSSAASSVETWGMDLVPLTFGANGIVADADELSVPFTTGTKGGAYEINVLTKDGVKTLMKHEENRAENYMSVPYTSALSFDGLIHARNSETQESVLYDREGSDRTAEYMWLKDGISSVYESYRIDTDRIAYGVHGSDVYEGSEKDVPGIYIRKISDGTEKIFPMSKVGLESLQGLQPLCLSADGESLYVRYQGWEGFSYEAIWKLNLSDLSVETIFGFDDKISAAYHCLDHSDLILAVRTEKNEKYGWGGAHWPPSELLMFNGADGTSKTLLRSEDKLISSALMSPDGKRIFYVIDTEAETLPEGYDDPYYAPGATSEYFVMNVDGTGTKSLGDFYRIAGMSHDGNILVVSQNKWGPYADSEFYFVVNTLDGRIAQLTDDGYGRTVSCAWGQGFDCHY